jgi:aminomethyltransferase
LLGSGPEAASYLQSLTSFDLRTLTFGKSAFVPIEGFSLHVARGGYTGEDGFEVCFIWYALEFLANNQRYVFQISIPPAHTLEVAHLLSKPPVQLTGLGARDSLRLEAGMCLYGQDLDEDTTPVEAGLSWVIGMPLSCAYGFLRYLCVSQARIGESRLTLLAPRMC